MKVAQSCPTLCDPMDYTVHEILQARILEWVAFPFSKWSSRPISWTKVSCIAGGLFTNWAIREGEDYIVPWTARRSNQSVLKEINPEYSLEELRLNLKFQYWLPDVRRANSLQKTLMLGKIKGRRRRGWQRWDGWMASLIQWTWVWANSGRRWRTGKPGMLQSMGSQKSQTKLSDWTTTTTNTLLKCQYHKR